MPDERTSTERVGGRVDYLMGMQVARVKNTFPRNIRDKPTAGKTGARKTGAGTRISGGKAGRDDEACIVFDATYRLAQKSANYAGQKRLWSEQKKMPLAKPMVGCSSDGVVLYVFGPFDATHNDATILQDCFQRYANDMSTIHEGDTILVDRGFRDVLNFLTEEKNLKAYCPGLGQLNTAEANASRCVTKCRWVIEQVFGRLKKKFKIFSLPAHNTTLKHNLDSLYIAFALLNLFHKPILSDVMHEGIAQTLKSRLNVPNRLQIIVQEFNLPQLRVPFLAVEYTSLDNEENNRLIGFPELSMDDLYYLSLGPYQIRNAISYYAEHQKEGIFLVQKFHPRPKHPSVALNYEKYGISVEEPTLIKAHMKSRYRGDLAIQDPYSLSTFKENVALRYGCEGVAESALVDDTLNGNPRTSSSTSSAILPQSHALQSESAGSIDAADTSGSRNYCEKPDNETAEMGGVPHVEGGLNSELYAVPVKRRQPKDQKNNAILQNNTQEKPTDVDSTDSEDKDENLPSGWQKHEGSGVVNTVTRSNTSSALDQELENKRKVELALKRRSYPARADSEGRDKPIRFAVRSLGWTEIAEEDLTPERSSKAVNKCIVDLSLGRNDLLDVVGRWGDGKDLFMDLDEGALKLIDPENLTVLNTQPIHTVRVWGVGRDHCRDFAYVARDRSTRKHMCHVFRCDIPARTIANTLRDICKKIMIERSQHQTLAKPVDINGRTSLATRPTNLPTEHRRFHRNGQALVTQSFPTPMEEPKKVLRAQYLGSMQVNQATGMEVLNEAIEHIVANTPINQWRNVNVAVAPSMISILTPNEDKLITECRVRYLSFLGIGRNVKQCAFIMHTAQDLFIVHVFNCEPSSGALCKTIEAACKLRYQKCLDAHPQGFRNASSLNTPSGRGLGATLKSLELWPLPAEREVIRHRHLQSPLTLKYFGGSPPSASLKSLLSPSLDTRHIQLARWESNP
ncbi:hypothetical protein DMN91_011673 [Ooceraea biroi]|uniref:PID domain-containing protein n=1 Tax=Ooceraea biroi TaxID=2015173 RepID=A0A3L8D6N6_OOCBI|nr:hypothetical protein DMN91_011673 [Ooceraea biroi]